MPMKLESLAAKAAQEGWASGSASIDQVRMNALALGWTEVPVRRGGPSLVTLRPVDTSEAPANSLSAKYGKGAQPLHTDGAHLAEPPDVIVLVCNETSRTPTLLWIQAGRRGEVLPLPDYMKHGIFLVQHGKDSFLSACYSGSRLRYDPGCMIPCDARARKAVHFFEKAINSAYEHCWDKPGEVLLIDNRKALHARAAAADDPDREVMRVAFHIDRREA